MPSAAPPGALVTIPGPPWALLAADSPPCTGPNLQTRAWGRQGLPNGRWNPYMEGPGPSTQRDPCPELHTSEPAALPAPVAGSAVKGPSENKAGPSPRSLPLWPLQMSLTRRRQLARMWPECGRTQAWGRGKKNTSQASTWPLTHASPVAGVRGRRPQET